MKSYERWRELALLLLILGLACFLRIYRIDVIPPGLWHDEAFNGMDSLRTLKTGSFRIFYEGNGGREPLLIWLQTIPISLLGATPVALRLVPIVFGIATVPVFYLLIKEVFHEEEAVRWLALLGTAALATSYWHVNFSRVGFRAVLFLFFLVLGTYFFWQGWRTGRYHFFCTSGIIVGFTGYTYTPARLLPLLLVGFFVIGTVRELHSYIRHRRYGPSDIKFSNTGLLRWLKGFAIMGLLAILVFLPMGHYFLTHPGAFDMRTADVSVFSPAVHKGEAPRALLSNFVAVTRMFYDRGDLEWRHNLPGRPALDAFCAFGFSLGVVVSVLRSRKPTYAFVLLWLVVMLLPTILSSGAPNTLRGIGALPPVCTLLAIGFASTVEFFEKRIPRLNETLFVTGLLLMLLCFSGFLTFQDYFTVWAQRGKTFRVFDADRVALARHVSQLGKRAEIYLPLELYSHPTVTYLLDPYYDDVASILVLDEDSLMARQGGAICLLRMDETPRGTFVLLRREDEGRGVVYTMRPLYEDELNELIEYARPMVQAGQKVLDWHGRELAVEIPLDSPGTFFANDVTPTYFVEANLNNQVELLGFDLEPREAKADQVFRLSVYWQGLADMQMDYDVFVHLIDVGQGVWSQRDEQPLVGAYPTSLWRPGEIVPDFYEVSVRPGTPPGKYIFEVGLYQKTTGERLSVLDKNMVPLDDKVVLGPVNVMDPTAVGESPQHPARFGLGTAIAFLGHSLDRQDIRPGEAFHLTLYWEALMPIGVDYTVFTHLIDSNDQIWAQQDGAPQAGRNPTSLWYTGEMIRDEYTLLAESDTPAGEYSIEIGMYEFSTGQRLPVMTAAGDVLGDRLLLGWIRVIE